MNRSQLDKQTELSSFGEFNDIGVADIGDILDGANIHVGNVRELERKIHDLANINPVMSYIEFEALKHSIRQNGLFEPILLYQGKVIDGRNRINALRALDEEEVPYRKIKDDTSIDLVEKLVIIKETRRKQTSTQLAITALTCIQSGIYKTHKEAAKAIGISPKQIQRAKQVSEYLSDDEMNTLHAGGVYTTRSEETTSSLENILRDCRDREVTNRVQPLFEVNFNGDIETSEDFIKAERLINFISCENLSVQIYCKRMLDEKLSIESGQPSS